MQVIWKSNLLSKVISNCRSQDQFLDTLDSIFQTRNCFNGHQNMSSYFTGLSFTCLKSRFCLTSRLLESIVKKSLGKMGVKTVKMSRKPYSFTALTFIRMGLSLINCNFHCNFCCFKKNEKTLLCSWTMLKFIEPSKNSFSYFYNYH